jgi:hypothetical protein
MWYMLAIAAEEFVVEQSPLCGGGCCNVFTLAEFASQRGRTRATPLNKETPAHWEVGHLVAG